MDENKDLAQSQTTPPVVPDIEIRNIRTYKDDISQTVKIDKITTAKILMAEQNKRLVEEKVATRGTVTKVKNTFAVLASLVLVVASIGMIGYFGYTKITTPQPIANPQASTFLFVYESENFINASQSKQEIEQEIELIRSDVSQSPSGSFSEIVFFRTDEDSKTNVRITSLDFFRLFEIPLLTNIARSFSQDFTYGFYNNNGRVEPFLVVGLVDYENTYANMFTWESTLALDVKEVFPVLKNLFDVSTIMRIPIQEEIASTTEVASLEQIDEQEIVEETATTSTAPEVITPPEISTKTINQSIRFEDVILSNFNTRALRNENRTPFFYYAFLNKEKILFAQDPTLVGEIIRKMRQKDLVR